jgi:hypothetical protein
MERMSSRRVAMATHDVCTHQQAKSLMSSGDPLLSKAIGEMLIERYRELVEQPLPPLILQLLRQLHAKTERGEDDDALTEEPRRMRADLFLPDARGRGHDH